MKNIFSSLIIIFAVILILDKAVAGETITIAGDPCTVPLAKTLSDAFTKKTGIGVNILSAGCMSGVYKASAGEVEIGVSTQIFLSDELPSGMVKTVIAKAPIVFIVNKANPVNNLTFSQVQGILAGRIKNWKEVGGRDMKIQNVMLQPCVTMTIAKQAASHYGTDIERLVPEKKGNPVKDTNQLVENNEGAIGLQLYGYETPGVKVLTIDGYLPNEDTFPVKYRFYEDYNVITKGEPRERVKEFIDFVLSPEGQSIVTSMRHIRVKR